MSEDRDQLLEEEVLLVRHCGEMPEVAFHALLYFLCEDRDGPQLELRAEEKQILITAALDQYLDIILRDLNPDNRRLPLYRGLARAVTNWHRLRTFCDRVQQDSSRFRQPVRQALCTLLYLECRELCPGTLVRVNCSRDELCGFWEELQRARISHEHVV